MADEILIVEDDDSIRRLLRISLKTEGYRVSEAKSATVALSLFEANAPVLVLLDLGLPDRDGMEVLAGIRSRGTTPVIVVTARSQDDQKVAALDAGADDYVVKPFSMAELFARIRVALRHRADSRRQDDEPRLYSIDGLEIDDETRAVRLDGAAVHLTPYEYGMLVVMVRNRAPFHPTGGVGPRRFRRLSDAARDHGVAETQAGRQARRAALHRNRGGRRLPVHRGIAARAVRLRQGASPGSSARRSENKAVLDRNAEFRIRLFRISVEDRPACRLRGAPAYAASVPAVSTPSASATTAKSGTTTLMQYSENTIAKNTITTMNTTFATLLGSLPMSFSRPG